MSDSATSWIAAHQASLSITNSWSLLKLMSVKSVMPSSHLILCHPLLLLPPIPPRIRVFSNESFPLSSPEVAKVLEFQLQHQSFQWTQDWSPLGWTGWISLQSKGLSGVFSITTVQKHQFFGTQLSSHILILISILIFHLLYPFIIPWTLRLFPNLGFCK